MKGDDTHVYQLELRGQVDADEINVASPLQLTVVSAGAEATRLAVRTDQSGLIGLIRHLHALGFVFLAVVIT